MIVVKLMGGLGNQMFQYAAGRALAQRHGVPLLLDESFLHSDPRGNYTKREPELQQLKVVYKAASRTDVKNFEGPNFWERIFGIKKGSPDVLIEGKGLNKEYFSAGPHVYLRGFWQSESYFIKYRDVLLKEFAPAYDLAAETGSYLSRITATESVGMHVRRGDYVALKSASDFHGVQQADYYRRAADLIYAKVSSPAFFIFSDDLEWCRQNFEWLSGATFVNSHSSYSSADLFLMKYCRHQVIANSSYSWWAAWLNSNPSKIVVAPSRWLLAEEVDAEHIYCKDWIRL